MLAVSIGLAAGFSGSALAASDIFIDPPDDAAGGLDIQSVFVSSDNGELSMVINLDQAPVLPGDAVTVSIDTDADARTGDFDGKEWWAIYQLSSFSGAEQKGLVPYRPELGGLDLAAPNPPSFSMFGSSRLVIWKVSQAEIGLNPNSVIAIDLRSNTRTTTGVTDRLPEFDGPRLFFSLSAGKLKQRVRDPRCTSIPARVTKRNRQITTALGVVRRAKTPKARSRATRNLKILRSAQTRDKQAVKRLCDLSKTPATGQAPVLPKVAPALS